MNRVELPGSDRHEVWLELENAAVHPDEVHDFTVRIKGGPGLVESMVQVEGFLLESGNSVVASSDDQRTIKAAGTATSIKKMFGVDLRHRERPDVGTYVSHQGPVTIPADLVEDIEGVFGLDKRPVAKPHFRRLPRLHAELSATRAHAKIIRELEVDPTITGDAETAVVDRAEAAYRAVLKQPAGTFTPVQLAELYNFPAGDGHGQCIAIIELGGGYKVQDLRTYFGELGIKMPTVTWVSVDHGRNQPGSDADGEVMLDIEVAAAIAPMAKIVCYFAPNTDQGFMDAVSAAIHDQHYKPSVISISWGGPESSWSAAALKSFDGILSEAAAKGITITVAAGDNGSDDGVGDNKPHADFPASSPHVLACGGTKVTADNGQITDEVVWNETDSGEGAGGGAPSSQFPVPDYQAGVLPDGVTHRGVPDVAADADPTSGYCVRVDGSDQVIGGTSAAAPLFAGLVARLNQITGKRLGFANPKFYANPSAFRDITGGNNGEFSAKPGYDLCTGLGSPNGVAILEAVK